DHAGLDPVSVNYGTANGTATLADNDYVQKSGGVTFAPGVTSQTVTIDVNGDAKYKADETFSVTLSGARGATIDVGQATGTIRNDDPAPAVSVTDISGNEGNSGLTPFSFTLRLSAPSGLPATVQYATLAGTATAGTDYQSATGSVTFAAGQ